MRELSGADPRDRARRLAVCHDHVTIDQWMEKASAVVAGYRNPLADSEWLLDSFIDVYRDDICTGTHCRLDAP